MPPVRVRGDQVGAGAVLRDHLRPTELPMPSVMSFPTRIIHGRGAVRELPAELKRAGVRKVLLVTDKGILQAGLLRFVTPLLEQAGMPFTVFSEFDPNPTDADALKGIEAYRAGGADAIVAVGGGASLDMGKAIRLLAHHDPPLDRYDDAKGGDKYITDQQPPFLAVPNTAGTHHGLANSLMLPTVIQFNRPAAEERLATAAVALGADPRMSAQERAQACAAIVDDLRAACGLPRKLSQAGVKREMIPRLVAKAMADACHQSNPRPCTQVDFERIIEEAF